MKSATMMHSTCQILAELVFGRVRRACVTIYFWWENIKGMHESSGKALRIMQITTVMVVIFLIWCPITLILRGPARFRPLPLPSQSALHRGRVGLVQGHVLACDSFRRDHHRLRALAAVHERV